jgi:hypothetical protein
MICRTSCNCQNLTCIIKCYGTRRNIHCNLRIDTRSNISHILVIRSTTESVAANRREVVTPTCIGKGGAHCISIKEDAKILGLNPSRIISRLQPIVIDARLACIQTNIELQTKICRLNLITRIIICRKQVTRVAHSML